MKNIGILCLIILLTPGIFLKAQKTGYIARAIVPPSIDGTREDEWSAANSYPIDYNYNGTFDGPAIYQLNGMDYGIR